MLISHDVSPCTLYNICMLYDESYREYDLKTFSLRNMMPYLCKSLGSKPKIIQHLPISFLFTIHFFGCSVSPLVFPLETLNRRMASSGNAVIIGQKSLLLARTHVSFWSKDRRKLVQWKVALQQLFSNSGSEVGCKRRAQIIAGSKRLRMWSPLLPVGATKADCWLFQ